MAQRNPKPGLGVRAGNYATALIMVLGVLSGCGTNTNSADTVLTNGRFFTATDDAQWATSVAIDDGKIVYVGDEAGSEKFIGDTTTTRDLEGKLVLPGLVDGHTHPGLISRTSDALDLPAYGTIENVLTAVADYAAANPDKEFIVGGYWQTRLFDEHGRIDQSSTQWLRIARLSWWTVPDTANG